MRNVNCTILSAVDTSTQSGASVDSNQLLQASFQAIFGDTTAVGIVKIQFSNDICNDRYQANAFTPTHWTDIPSASVAVTAGVAPGLLIPVMAFRWIRAVWTSTTPGTTTVTVNMNALGT